MLPIVMGASEEEYRRAAPHNSFIHVDQFEGPEQLAEQWCWLLTSTVVVGIHYCMHWGGLGVRPV